MTLCAEIFTWLLNILTEICWRNQAWSRHGLDRNLSLCLCPTGFPQAIYTFHTWRCLVCRDTGLLGLHVVYLVDESSCQLPKSIRILLMTVCLFTREDRSLSTFEPSDLYSHTAQILVRFFLSPVMTTLGLGSWNLTARVGCCKNSIP